MKDLIETGAEALWQAENIRTRGKPRSVTWQDVNEADRERYRVTFRLTIRAIEAEGYRIVHVDRAVSADIRAAKTWGGE